MRHTVVGIVASADGLAYDPAQHRRAWSTPAAEVRTTQAQRIPVDVEHSHRWVGEIVYLERHAGNLWAVAEVDTEPTVAVKVGAETVDVPTELYYSAERSAFDEDILLRSVALTRAPARVGARPLTWFAGDLGRRSAWVHDNPLIREIIARAGEYRHTRHGRALVVHGDSQAEAVELDGGGVLVGGELIPRGAREDRLAFRTCRILSVGGVPVRER